MRLNEFIKYYLIKEIGSFIPTHAYLAFGLISQGIEFIGACIDEHDFHQIGKSSLRFNAGLKLFDTKYHSFADSNNPDCYLYEDLRCGLLHVVKPHKRIALGQKQLDPYPNLSKQKLNDGTERYVLIIEDFYNDYKNACKLIIDELNNGSLLRRANMVLVSIEKREILELKKDFMRGDL